MFHNSTKLLRQGEVTEAEVERLLTPIGFTDWRTAHRRFLELGAEDTSRRALEQCLPMLLSALYDAAQPDISLLNFERFAQTAPDRSGLFHYLAANPRAVEILVKLFVGSQFLTEILLRNPSYLEQLTQHKRLAECKSRPQFLDEAGQATAVADSLDEKLDALRRFHHWELLRIGACDSFGLMDLKTVTVQLSLLADSVVQSGVLMLAETLDLSPDGFAVLALGKLGGEELNYSSDIDLVFVAEADAPRYWPLGQRLIKALQEATGEGFLYRVDMRLRPWGRSGALVTSLDAYIEYLNKHGMLWEKQALLKARPMAGNLDVGRRFLDRAEPLIFEASTDEIRASVRHTKEQIEDALRRQGKEWGEVKSGVGSIRDIEFVTQFLQLVHGAAHREVRSFNTLNGLVRLTDFGFLEADEFRRLTGGYVFLRTIEHSLQLMHHKQVHALPEDKRELSYLARRLDFSSTDEFLSHYQKHCSSVRAIYAKYVEGEPEGPTAEPRTSKSRLPDPSSLMDPDYSRVFTQAEIERHAVLLDRLGDDSIVEVEARPVDDNHWLVTVAGFDQLGDLSMICGTLFVHGFNIVDGNVFTAEHVATPDAGSQRGPSRRRGEALKFIDVFTVRQPAARVSPDVWTRCKDDLSDLLKAAESDRREAQGRLAKRVGRALRDITDPSTTLFPVDIQIDNSSSPRSTVMHIHATDTIGFLYELCNALTSTGIDIRRVTVSTTGNIVQDTLYVTDADGNKIVDEDRQRELRAAVVLIKHFTHLLPRSPNPERGLLHFRSLLELLFQQPNWPEELASLERTDVLDGLARLLGVSDFLWEDFLRLQHENLFPVVKDVEALEQAKSREALEADLQSRLQSDTDIETRRVELNAFKDREMFRIDMRHILGHISEFGQFATELTEAAEVVVAAGTRMCDAELRDRHGISRLEDGRPCPVAVCALGKCGGRELGFASDIELMFVYEGSGKTDGPETITTTEYFLKLVERFTKAIRTRRKGIFEIDLRLRPYGRAGSLAVSYDAFRDYFSPNGAAWPYERQALVKLRPIAGDSEFGERIVRLRDELVYTNAPFDVAAMRAMREKQVRQLVKAGTVNVKLSPGGVVDIEYLVQGLQMTYGHRDSTLRATATVTAMKALEQAGILPTDDHMRLREAYIFQRRLIDALRMVRGDARDLTAPPADSEEFEFLAQRLGYGSDIARLQTDVERITANAMESGRLLDRLAQS